MGGKRRRRDGVAALFPKNFSGFTRWKVDQDYLGKLTPEEQRWLADFNNAYYAGDFRDADPKDWPVDARRKSWNAHKTERYDAYTHAVLGGSMRSLDVTRVESEEPARDLEPVPSYLNEPEYRAARDAFRKKLAKGRAALEPEKTSSYYRARRRLVKATPTNENQNDDEDETSQ